MYFRLILLCLGLVSGQLSQEWEFCHTGPCQCNHGDNEVVCEDVTITDIFLWQHFPANLNRVVLRNNDIDKFPPNFFSAKRLENLIELFIDENPLTELEARDFLTAPLLQTLQVENSEVSDLAGDLLMHLQNLKNLRLYNNNFLKYLPECLLYGLDELTHVSIHDNSMITDIPRRFFWGPSNIQHISFNNNSALTSDSIPYDVCHSSNTVRYFRLVHSRNITTVKNTWFKNMNNAEYVQLRLYSNGIQEIERGAFDGVLNIDVIGLDYNDLSIDGIPDNLFNNIADTDKPVTVNMRNNPRLTTLPTACNIEGVICNIDN